MNIFLLFLLTLGQFQLFAQSEDIPFFPNRKYDISIPPPDSVIGFSIGKKPVRYSEVYKDRMEHFLLSKAQFTGSL